MNLLELIWFKLINDSQGNFLVACKIAYNFLFRKQIYTIVPLPFQRSGEPKFQKGGTEKKFGVREPKMWGYLLRKKGGVSNKLL